MDELEILKRDWKKKENSFNQVSEKEIYGMLHRTSSSIVKWILIISILEILLWSSITFLTADDDYFKTLEMYHLNTIMPVITFVNYAVILVFIYLFYKNYKAINTTESVKSLMQNIIKTRKTVNYYVWYNIGMAVFSFVLVFIFQFLYDPNIRSLIDKVSESMNSNLFCALIIMMYIVIIAVFVGIIWLFYKLLYGILMRRLQKNYNELSKIDF
jgi:NADH:ubiquinone oxidoreductase subunit K